MDKLPTDSPNFVPSGKTASIFAFGENAVFAYCFASNLTGSTILYWQVKKGFTGAEPYTFYIYRNYNYDDEDWTELHSDVDIWSYTDTAVELTAKDVSAIYKIKLVTNDNQAYWSPIVHVISELQPRHKLLARAILKRTLLTPRHLTTLRGYLFKRKLRGTTCSCVDPLTGEVTWSDCPQCFGTGIVHGYWKNPTPHKLITQTPIVSKKIHDATLQLGHTAPSQVQAKAPGLPPLEQYDVWVQENSNRRFYIVAVQVAAELQGFPLVYDLIMRQAPYTDIVYKIPITTTT